MCIAVVVVVVQGICYREEQLELEAAAVSRAALLSKQEPIGTANCIRVALCNRHYTPEVTKGQIYVLLISKQCTLD